MIWEEGLLGGASRCSLLYFSPAANHSRDLIILECVCVFCLKGCQFLLSPHDILVYMPTLHPIEQGGISFTQFSLTKEDMVPASYQMDEILFS